MTHMTTKSKTKATTLFAKLKWFYDLADENKREFLSKLMINKPAQYKEFINILDAEEYYRIIGQA